MNQDEEFGEARLCTIIQDDAPDHTAQELTDLIMQAVSQFTGGRGGFDDETMIIVKRQD